MSEFDYDQLFNKIAPQNKYGEHRIPIAVPRGIDVDANVEFPFAFYLGILLIGIGFLWMGAAINKNTAHNDENMKVLVETIKNSQMAAKIEMDVEK